MLASNRLRLLVPLVEEVRVVLELLALVVPVRQRPVLLAVLVLLLVEAVAGGQRLVWPSLEFLATAVASCRVVEETRRLLEAVFAVRVRPVELVAAAMRAIVSVGAEAAPIHVDEVVRVCFQAAATAAAATGLLRRRVGCVAERIARVMKLVVGVLRLLPVLVILVRVEIGQHLVPKGRVYSMHEKKLLLASILRALS